MKRSIFTLFLILHSILLLNAQNVSVYPNLGHRGLVASFAFNTELNILASVSIGESFIKLWDADNAREIKTIPTEATFFHSIIWNNTTLICGLWSGEIIFIDFNSGDELHRWKAHRGSVNSLHLNHDKNELLSASFDGTIKKWDALTGKEIAIVKDINASVNRAIYSSNGNFIVAAFSDGTVRKYDTVNNNELLVIQAHTGHVLSIDCNSDASLIISGGFDGILKTWNNGELRQSATTNSSPVTSVALSPDNERAVSGSTDGILYEWNISTGQKLNEFFSHEMSISNVQYKNNEIVYSASYDNRIKEWQMTSKEEVNHFSSYSDIVNSIVLSSNGEYIISGHSQVNDLSDSCIYIWESKTGALVNTLERQKKGILSVDITPDGKTIASGSEDAIVRIWDIENNTVLHTLYGHNTFVTTVSFSPDGTKLASSSYDGTVKIWDTNTGRFITEYKIEEQRIFDVKWNPNGNQLAAAANGVHFWDLQFPINSFVIETEPIHNITYNPDGSRLAGGTQQNTLYIWDTKKGEEIFSKEGDINANIIALCYSPNGMYIAFAIQNVYQTLIDTSIKIWDAETGDLLTQLDGHDSTVTDIHFTQDSKRIISSSSDSTIRIWDLDINEATGEITGSETLKMIGFTNGEWISITPEGYYVASPNGAYYLNVKIGDKVYGMNQYREIFRKPNVVAARLMGRDYSQLGVTDDIRNISTGKPEIEILSETLNEAKDTVTLMISVNDERDNLKRLEFYLNDSLLGDDVLRVVGDSGNLRTESAAIAVTTNTQRLVFQIPIPLNSENNRIKIIAHNSSNVFGEKTVDVIGKPQEGPPNLWILAIGINHYPHERQNIFHPLNYAVNDAHAFVESFEKQAGPGKPYRTVNARIISDRSGILPTRENIINNLEYLKNRSSNDLLMLFISCHGLNDDDGNFYFIPSDFFTNPDGSIPFNEAAVSSEYIKNALWDARGRKMVFIDACHSGSFEGANMRVDNSQLVSSISKESIIIMTASKGSELSEEHFSISHGAFTFCFLEGKNGKATAPGEKDVHLMEIFSYVRRNVPRVVRKGPQTPDIFFPVGHHGDQIMAILD